MKAFGTDLMSGREAWRFRTEIAPAVLMCGVILFALYCRWNLLDFPLERDEGEYAYFGQLISQGVPPYSLAYNMKFPGTYFVYFGLMAIFGQTVRGIHAGLLVLNALTILLIYALGRRFVGRYAAVAAGGVYAILSLSPSVLGFAGHATHFVAASAVAGFLILMKALEKDRLRLFFLSGSLFALSGIMKQPGFLFCVFGLASIVYADMTVRPFSLRRAMNIPVFMLGAAAPVVLTFAGLYAAGVFDTFWFWTVKYSSQYASQIPLSAALRNFTEAVLRVVDGFRMVWIFAALGLAALFLGPRYKPHRFIIAMFFLWSFLTVCPGFYFREHYFIALLPAVSLLVGIFSDYFIAYTGRWLKAFAPLAAGVLLVAAILAGVVSQRGYFLATDPVRLSAEIYGGNPFPESLVVADFIREHSAPEDRILAFGSEPQIYFYSGRHSATGYIYTYNLMERHAYSLPMQQEMIREVEAAFPKFIVVVNVYTSWLIRPDSEKYIFSWLEDYLVRGYHLVGVADIISGDNTVYAWYEEAEAYPVQSSNNLLIYERNMPGI